MVTVNDGNQISGRCWICDDPTDHSGVPHSVACGDGVTRFHVVEIMNANGLMWRPSIEFDEWLNAGIRNGWLTLKDS